VDAFPEDRDAFTKETLKEVQAIEVFKDAVTELSKDDKMDIIGYVCLPYLCIITYDAYES